MALRKRLEGTGTIISSMFVLWWTLFVMAYVSDSAVLDFLSKWSPLVLIPWGVIDVWRHNR